jgi:hypothetical protein
LLDAPRILGNPLAAIGRLSKPGGDGSAVGSRDREPLSNSRRSSELSVSAEVSLSILTEVFRFKLKISSAMLNAICCAARWPCQTGAPGPFRYRYFKRFPRPPATTAWRVRKPSIFRPRKPQSGNSGAALRVTTNLARSCLKRVTFDRVGVVARCRLYPR